jgi:hypothetical protein
MNINEESDSNSLLKPFYAKYPERFNSESYSASALVVPIL